MKKCYNVSNLFSQYIDGQLNEMNSFEFEKHIQECASCKEELNQLNEIVNTSNNIGEVDLPENFSTNLHEKLLLVNETKLKTNTNKIVNIRNKYLRLGTTIAACLVVVFLLQGFINRNYFSGLKKDSITNNAMINKSQNDANFNGENEFGVDNSGDQEFAALRKAPIEETIENSIEEKSEDNDYDRSVSSRDTSDTSRTLSINEDESLKVENRNVNISYVVNENIDTKTNELKDFLINNGAELSDYVPLKLNDIVNASSYRIDEEIYSVEKEIKGEVSEVFYSKIRNENFDELINLLKSNFNDSNFKIFNVDIEDYSDILEGMRAQLIEIDNKIQVEENSDKSSDPDFLTSLKKERQDIWYKMDKIHYDTNYTFLTVEVKSELD